jgi:hypothetical protein
LSPDTKWSGVDEGREGKGRDMNGLSKELVESLTEAYDRLFPTEARS